MSDWLHGVEVPPLKISNIRDVTETIRSASSLNHAAKYPVLSLLEHWMHLVFDGYDWEVREHLPNNQEACCYPDGCPDNPNGPLIILREDVYDAACSGNGRARFTVAHEIGHVFLHKDVPSVHNRMRKGADLQAYENSEWQANTFAGELLMPKSSFAGKCSLDEYCEEMGVSREAAFVQAKKLVKRREISRPQWFQSELDKQGVML